MQQTSTRALGLGFGGLGIGQGARSQGVGISFCPAPHPMMQVLSKTRPPVGSGLGLRDQDFLLVCEGFGLSLE